MPTGCMHEAAATARLAPHQARGTSLGSAPTVCTASYHSTDSGIA